jgi:1-acyl-sn-glycerol-3-phosphate acyltransferase
MRTLLVVLFIVLFLLVGYPVLGVEWLIARRHPEHADTTRLHLVQWAFRCITVLSGVKLTVKGQEKIPKNRSVLYIANHRSFFDIVVTYPLFPDLTGFIAKDILRKIPAFGLWMKRVHCLFLDRKDLKRGLKTILDAIEKVKKGISIVIFPEGTRNRQADPTSLLPFRDGSFKIAQKAGCPIVPIAIIGTEKAFENHIPWIRSTEVTVVFGDPVDLNELPPENRKKIGAYCQNILSDMLKDNIQVK